MICIYYITWYYDTVVRMIARQPRPVWSYVLSSIIHTMTIADTACNQLCRFLLRICIYYITGYFVCYITKYIMWYITIWYTYAYYCVSLTIIHPVYFVTIFIKPISFILRIVLLHILGLCMLLLGDIILIHLSCILFSSMYVYCPSLDDTIVRLYIKSYVCYYLLILSLEISYDTVFIYIILFELFRFIFVLLFWGGLSLSLIMPYILCSYI